METTRKTFFKAYEAFLKEHGASEATKALELLLYGDEEEDAPEELEASNNEHRFTSFEYGLTQ